MGWDKNSLTTETEYNTYNNNNNCNEEGDSTKERNKTKK